MSWMPPQGAWLRRKPGGVAREPAGALLTLMERALTGGNLHFPTPEAPGAGSRAPGREHDYPEPGACGRLVVLGAFGSGKTESARRVGAALGVPVIPLRVLARSPDLERTLETLAGGADVAILDGLDEIGRPDTGDAPAFVEQVTRPFRRWVLTSRPGHVRTDVSAHDLTQVDCFHLPLVEILPYPVPQGVPSWCGDSPVLLAMWGSGARGATPGALVADYLGPTGAVDALEQLAWAAFVDPGRSVESASFSAAELVSLPAWLFVEDLDGRWRFGHRSLYDALVARRLARRLAAGQGGGPDDLTDLVISGAMRAFLVGPFPGWPHDEDFVHVSRGNFVSGGPRSSDERPLVIRHLPRPVRLARRPVSNAEFQSFLDQTGPRLFSLDYLSHWRGLRCPDAILDHPVINLRPEDAEAYAAWAGGALPSADAWEKAVRGWDGRWFPWGDRFDPALANTAASGRDGTCPIDQHPQGSGLFSVIGDAFEYTTSHYRGRIDRGRVTMGGSWAHPPVRASLRLSHTLSGRLRSGLRLCVPDPALSPPR